MLDRSRIDIRQLLPSSAAVVICVWTGYFLCHTWQTLDKIELVSVVVGVLCCYVGMALVIGGTATERAGPILAMLGLVLAWWARPVAAIGAGLIPFFVFVEGRTSRSNVGTRFLFGAVIAAAAAFAGLTTAWPISRAAGLSAAGLACYVGLAQALRGPRPLPKATFTAVFVLLVAAFLALAGVGLGSEQGYVAAVLLAYLAIRLGVEGAWVLKDCTSEKLRSFGYTALACAGLFAGALLVLQIGEGERTKAELAWPVVLFALSIVLLRLKPYMVRTGAKLEQAGDSETSS